MRGIYEGSVKVLQTEARKYKKILSTIRNTYKTMKDNKAGGMYTFTSGGESRIFG